MWNKLTFLKILPAYIAGILLYSYFKEIFIVTTLSILVLLVGLTIIKTFKLHLEKVTSLIILFLFTCMGYITSHIYNDIGVQKTNTTYGKENSKTLLLKVIKPPKEKERTYKILGKLIPPEITPNQKPIHCNVYLAKSEQSKGLEYGDILAIKNKLKQFSPPLNPHEFNSKLFFNRKGIYYNIFLKESEYRLAGNDNQMLWSFIYNLRSKILTQLNQILATEENFSVGASILIGAKEFLTPETKEAFAQSGVIHILAVSGLHVGIIYLLLHQVLSLFPFLNRVKPIKYLITILALCLYAVITGLPPSIVRATIMFIAILFAKVINRKINIYNAIAFAALLMLSFNPNLIYDVGFLLSFTALTGIIYIQPKLYNLVKLNNWLLDKIWVIATVSIAAQIATAPITMYYFHQFPIYFLIGNILILPIVTLIMYTGLTSLLLSVLPHNKLYEYLINVFNFLLKVINEITNWIHSAPLNSIENVVFPALVIPILYFVIFTFSSNHISRRLKLYISLFTVLLISSIQSHKAYSSLSTDNITIYHLNGKSAIQYQNGRGVIIISDSLNQYNYNIIENNLLHSGMKNCRLLDISIPMDSSKNLLKRNEFIQLGATRLLVVDSIKNLNPNSQNKISIDYIIISNTIPPYYLNSLKKKLTFKGIIVDGSVPDYLSAKWKNICEEQGIFVHITARQGALVL